jgi:hypothetical protein
LHGYARFIDRFDVFSSVPVFVIWIRVVAVTVVVAVAVCAVRCVM